MLVIITKRFDSSVIKQKILPTPLDNEGNPKFAIYLNENRAATLIEAGVAIEYIPVIDDSMTLDDQGDANDQSNASDQSDADDQSNITSKTTPIQDKKQNKNNKKTNTK